MVREHPLSEITLRKYEKPFNLKDRDLVRKLCLSIGLLQPGDSRDVIVDIFHVLLKNKNLSSKEIEAKVINNRKQYKLVMLGIAPSNVRRQLKRLKDLYLIERKGNSYRLTENAKLSEIFVEKIENFYLKNIVSRVKEYFEALDQ